MDIATANNQLSTTVMAICPKAPPGAQVPTDTITGYVLWGVGISESTTQASLRAVISAVNRAARRRDAR